MCFTIWAFAVFNVFEMHYASPRLYLYHNTEAVEVQYFFTIHYYFFLPKNPECKFSEE